MIDCSFNIVFANWRIDNAKSSATMFQENQLGRHMFEYNTVRIPFLRLSLHNRPGRSSTATPPLPPPELAPPEAGAPDLDRSSGDEW